jgi:hypothetical protein
MITTMITIAMIMPTIMLSDVAPRTADSSSSSSSPNDDDDDDDDDDDNDDDDDDDDDDDHVITGTCWGARTAGSCCTR